METSDVSMLIRTLRRRLGLTQEQLAQRIGVTYSTVNHWENGKRVPQPFLLTKLRQLEAELALPRGSANALSPARTRRRGRPEGSQNRAAPVPRTTRGRVRKDISEMVKRIVERFQPEQVILFGSHARGEARADSDVDLLVVMPVRGSKRATQLEIRKALHDIPVPKDVIVTTPDEFERRRAIAGTIERPAVREGRRLYVRR